MQNSKIKSFLGTKSIIALLPAAMMLLLLVVTSVFWVQPALEELMLNQRKSQIKDLVRVGWSIADRLEKQVQTGSLTEEQAKQGFAEMIGNLRYGNQMKDYFWVHDMDGNIIIHPYNSSKNLIEYRDKSGFQVFKEMNDIVAQDEEGFIDYLWQWKDKNNSEQAKLSYLKIYKPWGWIIGSGFYKREAVDEIRALNRSFLGWLGFFGLLMILLILVTIKTGIKTKQLLYQKEKQAMANRLRFENMAKQVSHGIAILENGELVFHNQRLVQILDLDSSEKGKSFSNTVSEAIYSHLKIAENEKIEENAPLLEKEERGSWVTTKKGNRRYLVTRKTEDLENDATYYIVTDRTRRKQQLQEIKRLSQVVENCPFTVIITDRDGKIEYANAHTEEISGYQIEELIGNNPQLLKSNKIKDDTYRDLWNRIGTGKRWGGRLLNRNKSGSEYWEDVIISPMLDEEGEIEGYYSINKDITQQKLLEEELLKAKEKALESERIKSAFLNNISHEIRTPLNAISGLIQIMEDELSMHSEYVEHRESIEDNVKILLNLVDDILHISEIESQKTLTDYDYWNVDELITEIIERASINEKSVNEGRVSIKTSFDENLEQKTIFTDHSKLEVIFQELVSNAFKFTPSGSITVGYRKLNDQLDFFVNDTGVGISEEEKPNIFNLFYHGKEHYVSLHKGTGLGLNIVKKTARMMGGSVRFVSKKGEGSTFTVSGICELQKDPEIESIAER